MEGGNIAADVLRGSIAEHLQFGLVGPEDDAVGIDPVQSDGRVFDKVPEIAFALAQGQDLLRRAQGDDDLIDGDIEHDPFGSGREIRPAGADRDYSKLLGWAKREDCQ